MNSENRTYEIAVIFNGTDTKLCIWGVLCQLSLIYVWGERGGNQYSHCVAMTATPRHKTSSYFSIYLKQNTVQFTMNVTYNDFHEYDRVYQII